MGSFLKMTPFNGGHFKNDLFQNDPHLVILNDPHLKWLNGGHFVNNIHFVIFSFLGNPHSPLWQIWIPMGVRGLLYTNTDTPSPWKKDQLPAPALICSPAGNGISARRRRALVSWVSSLQCASAPQALTHIEEKTCNISGYSTLYGDAHLCYVCLLLGARP